ncbi:phosphopantetheine-binding protein [Streptomyces puniciscabiei]|uniref:phosphopantetheine-binding protein n=1 Tax=Streptomyces puniciscabiei TaxID=164348 RepID=UPI00331F82A7
MYTIIKDFFAAQFTVPDDQLTPDAYLTDIGIDSLALVELALVLEKESGFPVDDDDLKAARTLGELAELAEELTTGAPAAPRSAAVNAGG